MKQLLYEENNYHYSRRYEKAKAEFLETGNHGLKKTPLVLILEGRKLQSERNSAVCPLVQ